MIKTMYLAALMKQKYAKRIEKRQGKVYLNHQKSIFRIIPIDINTTSMFPVSHKKSKQRLDTAI